MKLHRLALLTLALLGACQSTTPKKEPRIDENVWLKPSPLLEEQIQSEARRLPWTRGVELMEQIRWFALVGEPAYPTLLQLAADERPHVASAALAALGATGDSRLVSFLHELDDKQASSSVDVGLERARALVRLGDWSAMPALIRGLSDDRVYTRSLCSDVLFEATGDRKGFDAKAPAKERELGVERWRLWWLTRTGEGLLD